MNMLDPFGSRMSRRFALLVFAMCCGASEAGRACSRVAPGLNRLARGVDVTELDLNPDHFSGSHGYRQRIIDYTCDNGHKWNLDGVSWIFFSHRMV